MKGWGSFSVLCMMGVAVGIGCGSRTGSLENGLDGGGGDGSGADGTGARPIGGSAPVAGKPSRGGSTSVGGAEPVAGAPIGGVGGYYGGAGGYFPGGAGGYYAGAGGYFPGGAGGYYGGAGGYTPGGASGAGGQTANCQTCIALTCGSELLQCVQDAGCADILVCVQATGCTGLDCYGPKTCRDAIDAAGGLTSDSTTRLLSAVTCMLQSGCNCD